MSPPVTAINLMRLGAKLAPGSFFDLHFPLLTLLSLIELPRSICGAELSNVVRPQALTPVTTMQFLFYCSSKLLNRSDFTVSCK